MQCASIVVYIVLGYKWTYDIRPNWTAYRFRCRQKMQVSPQFQILPRLIVLTEMIAYLRVFAVRPGYYKLENTQKDL